jgi:hypothetical protein
MAKLKNEDTKMKIYSMYGNIVADVADDVGAEIMTFCGKVQQNIGMGGLVTPPEGVTVRYSHRYGSGIAAVFFNGAQIASA